MAKIRKQVITNLTNQAYNNLKNKKDNIYLFNQNAIDDLINKIMSRCLIAFEEIMNNPENTKIIGQRIFEKCSFIIDNLIQDINLPSKNDSRRNIIHYIAEYLFVLKELRQNGFYNKAKFINVRKKIWDIEHNTISIYLNFLFKDELYSRFYEQKIRTIYKNKLLKLIDNI